MAHQLWPACRVTCCMSVPGCISPKEGQQYAQSITLLCQLIFKRLVEWAMRSRERAILFIPWCTYGMLLGIWDYWSIVCLFWPKATHFEDWLGIFFGTSTQILWCLLLVPLIQLCVMVCDRIRKDFFGEQQEEWYLVIQRSESFTNLHRVLIEIRS